MTMFKGMKQALLVLAAMCVVRFAAAQVAGFTFYRWQEVASAYTIRTVPATSPFEIADACVKTPRCNAFDTTGALKIVPMTPVFSVLDGSAEDVSTSDGIYVSQRLLSGLILQDGVDVDRMRQAGNKKLLDMIAVRVVAAKVAAKLAAKGLEVRKASKGDLMQAFKDAKVPLAQSSDTLGSYTYTDVVAALSYPEWDSRGANGTTYNYITSVKDQGGCGSCVAFAVTAMAEAAVGAVSGAVQNTNDFSEQWLFFCNGMYSPSCSQGWYASAATSVIVTKNIPYEINYPYTGAPGCTLASSPETRAGGKFSSTYFTDINLAKEHIRTYGSVTSYFAVYNDFFYWMPTSEPYVWDGVSALAGYHQVLTIGYNDTGSYWLVKNSWGTGWGDKGYFRISYYANVGFMSASGDNVMAFGWVPPITPSPSPSPPPSPAPIVCGDGTCSGNETCATCPIDCGVCDVCGDGRCSGGESCSTCQVDCGIPNSSGALTCCGDGTCNPAANETCGTCPTDCGVCPTCNKNGICESGLGEKCVSGSSGCSDCGVCSSAFCGDGKCTSARKGYSESCGSCPQDCGRCSDPQFCGDGICSISRNETSGTCARDCSKAKLRITPGVYEAASAVSVGNGVSAAAAVARPGKTGRRALRA